MAEVIEFRPTGDRVGGGADQTGRRIGAHGASWQHGSAVRKRDAGERAVVKKMGWKVSKKQRRSGPYTKHPITRESQAERLTRAIVSYGTRKQLAEDMARHGMKVTPQRISQILGDPYSITDRALRALGSAAKKNGHDYSWILTGKTYKAMASEAKEKENAARERGEAVADADIDAAECIATAFCALGQSSQMALAATACALLKCEMETGGDSWKRLLTTSAIAHIETTGYRVFSSIDTNELEEKPEPEGFERDEWDPDWEYMERERINGLYREYAEDVYTDILRTLAPYCTRGVQVPQYARFVKVRAAGTE